MKDKALIIILILTASISFSQNSDIISTRKISYGVTFSPDYCYRTLNSEASKQWVIDLRDSTEIAKFGFTTGISLIIKPWDRISLETGLHFSDKGEKTIILELNPIDPNDPALPTNQIKLNYHFYYLDIPIKANYIVLKGKANLFVSAGFSVNIHLSNQTIVHFVGSEEKQTWSNNVDLSRVNMAILIGGGIDYSINDKLNLRLEPIYRRSIIPINDASVKQYQYSIGANFGLFYKLK